ncbi:MAG: hypothetical protein LBH66_08790 [Oscillospiraceae bacterium]|jgi:hypothetical protein|nr:hypothetical protein [Oscillospiraceae bacterium]
MNDTKTNVTADPIIIDAPESTAELSSQPDGVTEIALDAPPESIDVGSDSGQNARNMLLMLAFVILLLAAVTMLDRIKTRRLQAKQDSSEPGNGYAPASEPIVETAGNDDEIAAVVAAVALMMSESREAPLDATLAALDAVEPISAGYPRVRRLRRNPSVGSAWRRSGIEEQVYSRMG